MISNDWLFQWKCFVSNKICADEEDLVN